MIGIDDLVVVFFQIHHAVFAEGGDARAGLRVQRDQTIAGRDVEDSFFGPIGPIGEAAARELARGAAATLAFVLAVHPELFAGSGVQRHHRAARAGRGVEDAVRHQRRPFQVVFRARTEVSGIEMPRELQLIEIRSVDLIERRVASVRGVAAVAAPFSVLGAGLREGRKGRDEACDQGAVKRARE